MCYLFCFSYNFNRRASKTITDPIEFNGFQNTIWRFLGFWMAILFGDIIPQSAADDYPIVKALWGLGFLAIGSSIIAFTIQVKAQKVISPHIAGLIFLLESPFAALFGIILLGEELNIIQTSGCVLILFSVFRAGVSKNKKEGTQE